MNESYNSVDTIDYLDEEEKSGFSLNLSDLRSMAYRQRYVLAASILAALLVGIIATMLMTPQYTARVSVQIEARSDKVVEDGSIEAELRGKEVQTYIQSQADLIKSRKMAERVANELRLTANDNFLVAMDIEPVSEADAGDNLQRIRRGQIIGALTRNVAIALSFGTNIADISFTSPEPALAVKIANAYAENLITGNIEQRFEATTYARDFLEKEIADAKKRLEDSEKQAILYARNAGIIDASDGVSVDPEDTAPRSITTANLVQMNSDAGAARTRRILAEEKWRQAQSTPLMSIPEVLENGSIQALQSERARKQAEAREFSDRYKPDHPVMQESNAEIASIDGQIRSLAQDIRNSIRDGYEVTRRQEASLNNTLAGLKGETLAEQNKRIELNLLSRDVDTNRTQYQSLLERYSKVTTNADVATSNISIIDEAENAGKVSPRPFINILLSIFAGLVLGGLLAFLRETFDDSVRSPDDVKRKLGLPLLGTTPLYDTDITIIEALDDRKSAIAEAYASARSSLDFSTAEGAPSSLLMTSSQPAEGKSTSAIALAESFGRAGKRVLLVDADLRIPSLHGYLGFVNNGGFVAALTGNSSLEREVQKQENVSFDFLSCGPIPPDPAELMVTSAIRRFLEQHSAAYDIILIDGPPVMGLADSPQIARAVEGTILVVEAGKVHGGQTKTAMRRLGDANANVLGVLLTKFDASATGYGDYYGYDYTYGRSKAEGKQKRRT